LTDGYLATGSENLYFSVNTDATRRFTLELKRDSSGKYIPEVAGFHFYGAFYRKE
jgi:hypothetical protein